MGGRGGGWILGCGIGCGVLILVGMLVVGGVFLAGKKTARHFARAVALEDSLMARCGRPEDYVPPPDGRIPPERLALFLAVRDSVVEAERDFLAEVESLDGAGGGIGRFLKALRHGVGSLSRLGEVIDRRDRALLAVGMNPGEYAWWTVMIYHCWLGQPLRPPELADREHFHLELGEQELVRVIRSRFVAQVDSAMAAGETQEWLAQLAAESRRLIREPGRLPWEDGLPRRTLLSLAGRREELEARGTPAACLLVGTTLGKDD